MRTPLLSCCAAVVLSLTIVSPVFAAAVRVVNVKLEDTSADGTMATMHMSLDQNVVKAGQVTFRALNESKTLVHEAIVVKIHSKNEPLPYDAKKGLVIESRIRHLGEIS